MLDVDAELIEFVRLSHRVGGRGFLIRAERLRQGIQQQVLGAWCHISSCRMSQFELGLIDLPDDDVARLVSALRFDPLDESHRNRLLRAIVEFEDRAHAAKLRIVQKKQRAFVRACLKIVKEVSAPVGLEDLDYERACLRHLLPGAVAYEGAVGAIAVDARAGFRGLDGYQLGVPLSWVVPYRLSPLEAVEKDFSMTGALGALT